MPKDRQPLREVLLPAVFVAGFLTVTGELMLSGRFSLPKGLGFLVGLFCGFLSYSAGAVRRARHSIHPGLRAVELILSPFGFVLALPFNLALAGGLFLGGATSYSIAWCVFNLFEGLNKHQATHSEEEIS